MKKILFFTAFCSATITIFLIPANSVLAFEPLFYSSLTYDAGDSPVSVCTGDLDGDNDLDLAVANYYSDNVSVLLNNGNGTYAAAVNYGAGDGPYSVCAGDLDGDNDLDLAVANTGSDNVSVLLNNGNGTYAAAVNYATGDGPYSVCAGDLDGDNDLDLAVANYYSDNVSVLLNNGDGTYAAAVNYGAGDGAISVCAGDLDGDNDLDLAVANYYSDNVSVLLNNGNGTYAAAVNYGAGDGPYSVCAGDLDGDNDLDLAVANTGSDNVSVLLNNGNGTYAAAVNYGAGDGPFSVCTGDLDGDNDLDLAVANSNNDNVSVLLNNGNGTYAAAVNYGAGDGPFSVCTGDLDGDNDLDLALANYYSDNVSVLLNNGNGTYAAAVNYGAGDGPNSVCAGDLDGDDDLDLAVAIEYSDNVSVLLNLSDRPIIPDISSIIDIPNDQGRQVRISWDRVCFDEIGGPVTVTEYAIYRQIDYYLTTDRDFGDKERTRDEIRILKKVHGEMPLYPPGDWDYLLSVPARAEVKYSVVVPTLADSTISEGMYYSTFFVSALTSTPGIYFDSAPDSGYSVDNLAPGVPQGFAVAYNTGSGNELTWEECPDGDFQYFRVYRSSDPDFVPSPSELVHSSNGTSWNDPDFDGWDVYYKITAIDFSGNESDAAAPGTATGVGDDIAPLRLALHDAIPNPFNPSTVISFALPGRMSAVLSVYTIEGKLVVTLINETLDAGFKEVTWHGKDSRGNQVSTGVYFYRLTAGNQTLTKKMVLLK